jgi:hypothetical protein
MPDASFGPYVSIFIFFLCFFDTNLCFIVFTGCNLHNTRTGECWTTRMTRKGPDDAGRVVWAVCECFFPFFLAFFDINLCFIVCTGCDTRLGEYRTATTNRKGLKDARHVVRVLAKFFSLLFVFLNSNLSFVDSNNNMHSREDSHDENGPE